MPVCYITLSENLPDLKRNQLQELRRIVAQGMDSRTKKLDSSHIVLRQQRGIRKCMLGDIEIEIFSQLYLSRLFSRDKRANNISGQVSGYLNCCCATWINMGMVGYARVTPDGDAYFSDSDNRLVRFFQQKRGIASKVQ